MYPGLNAFRAFAFFAVFLFHVYKLHAGYLGVMAFFVLSGFLLTPILLDMRDNFDAAGFFRRFYGRRALRIFPLYYFYLFFGALIALVALQWDEFPSRYQVVAFLDQVPLASLFLIDFAHGFADYEKTRLLTHFWSLAVEEQFYLVWPVVLFLIPRAKLRVVLLGLIATGPLIRWAIALDAVPQALPFLATDKTLLVYTLPFSHIDAFATGGYFALYGKSGSGRSVWVFFALAYAIGVGTAWMTTGTFIATELGYGPFMKDSAKHIWGYTLLNFVFAHTLIHIRDRKFLPLVFENKILDYLGRISYGLYVYHFGIIMIITATLPDTSELIQIPLALGLTILVSVLSYEYMEKWFLQFKDRFFERNSASDTPKGQPIPQEATS